MGKKKENSLVDTMRRFLQTDPKEVEKLEKKEKSKKEKSKKEEKCIMKRPYMLKTNYQNLQPYKEERIWLNTMLCHRIVRFN